jgi:hypothetical protein
VGPGFYTLGGFPNGTTRSSQALCPAASSNGGVAVYCPGSGEVLRCAAGFFGGPAGMTVSNCSGPCGPGYYCEAGSVGPGRECGSAQ